MQSIPERLANLERHLDQLDSEHKRGQRLPTLTELVAECQNVKRWLAEKGLTLEAAAAQGLTGPSGNHFITVQKMAQAHADVLAWRRERFGEGATADFHEEGRVPA